MIMYRRLAMVLIMDIFIPSIGFNVHWPSKFWRLLQGQDCSKLIFFISNSNSKVHSKKETYGAFVVGSSRSRQVQESFHSDTGAPFCSKNVEIKRLLHCVNLNLRSIMYAAVRNTYFFPVHIFLLIFQKHFIYNM